MLNAPTNNLYDQNVYDTVLRWAALPVLALIILLCWGITNRLMSPEWQEKRRNKQIRKAVAARNARLARSAAANEAADSDQTKTSAS
jgi:hypothetical protein